MRKLLLILELILFLFSQPVWGGEPKEFMEKIISLNSQNTKEMLENIKSEKNERVVEIILWRLSKNKLTDNQMLELLPYLNHKNDNIFSAAIEVLQKSNNNKILNKIKTFILGEKVFRARRAANALSHFHNDNTGAEELIKKVLDQEAPVKYRRELALELIHIHPRNTIEAFLDLLSDSNKWLRYNAFHQLRKITGQKFGYDYHQEPKKSRKAIKEWKNWWRQNRKNFEFKTPQKKAPIAGIGATLAIQDGYPIITEIINGFGAEKAGLRVGDKILEINGDVTYDKTVFELSYNEFQGKPNSWISLKVETTKGQISQVDIMREILRIKIVDGKMKKTEEEINP
jgi:hypothetical protein